MSLRLPLAAVLAAAQPLVAQTERIEWLRQHSVPISLGAEAAADDFHDIERLASVLAGARVVLLGELSHGEGVGSAARARLIRFLHQRLGFTVLVWEAGFYECHLMNEAISRVTQASETAADCLWPFWSGSEEIAALFEYTWQTRGSPSPLLMAGMDLQFTGRNLDRRLEDLQEWFRRAGAPLPRELPATTARAATPAPRDALLARAEGFAAHYQQNAAAIAAALGPREARRIERVIRNMTEYRLMLVDRDLSHAAGPDAIEAYVRSYNRRERVNAENLLWLLNDYYAGHKLIVWSHNVHAANTRFVPDYAALAVTDTLWSLDSTGRILKRELGAALYAVGTAAHGGQWGFPGYTVETIQQAETGSLEHWLNEAGEPARFVDLRTASEASHWLMQPLPGSLSAQVANARYPIVWPSVFDGVLFFQRMTAATARR